MFLVMLLVASQAVTPQPAAAPPVSTTPQADVVIIGNRMQDALEKCLARNCPPEEEVEAAMNAGAESFAAGRYREAKKTLRRAIDRNKKYGSRMPGRISDLYATYADVTEHYGEKSAFIQATRESVYVLHRELGETHPASISVSTRFGDMWVKLGRRDDADRAYAGAADDAERAGNTDFAAALTLRRAWLAFNTGDQKGARKLLDRLNMSHGRNPRFAPFLKMLQARLSIGEGKEDGIDALVAVLRDAGFTAPVLVHAPPYPEIGPDMSGSSPTGGIDLAAASANRLIDRSDVRWADIGFWVRPDGRTAEVEILRPVRNGQWAKLLIKQIEGRRYALANAGPAGIGVYRVERFSLRGDYGVPTGSRIRVGMGPQTLHVVDLTQLTARDGAPPAIEGSP